MKTFEYAAEFEPGEKLGMIIVTFPDVPEAITEGSSKHDAMRQASDALGVALLSYPMRGLPIPKAKARTGHKISVPADIAAKLAVLEAFTASGFSKSELARRISKDEREVRRILDPMHATKLATLVEVLSALGKRMVIGIQEAA
jgi:antitoxin HicB